MRRRIFNFLSATSLLLFVAMVTMWVRSYWVADLVGHEGCVTAGRPQKGGNVYSTWGHVKLEGWVRKNPASKPDAESEFALLAREIQPGARAAIRQYLRLLGGRDFLGFFFNKRQMDARPGARNPGAKLPTIRGTVWTMVIPYWFFAAVAAVLPTWSMVRRYHCWRSDRRRQLCLCVKCGYDLRASKERCPECGSPVPSDVADRPQPQPE